ncbi:mucin-5AC-like isoform X1 [Daphnia pulicaria]|uniref:mucin-5AC-like isoform X1 n=2 Tax=Daphnia pulicaria TaxID=35523 RepID=UPI001EEA712A|nr:mucin-5AC-like isoform X1 [Daphnia pulicaria]XP_046654393.1 mucin-5AC-like isoform X1 [Daphnia pulicaria]
MKLFLISFLLLVISLAVAAETQSAKQRSSSKGSSDNRLTSRNFADILKPEMVIRSLPSNGKTCLDRFSMEANGTVRPTINNSSNGQRQCSFFINAPANKLIRMNCSVVSLKSPGAGLVIYGGSEINVNPPAVNQIYTSRSDSMFLFFRVDNTDWFDCKWETIPVPKTTEYQLCRDGSSTAPNGTIKRSAEDNSTEPRMCMFAITVSSDRRIQFICSNISLNSPGSYLQLVGVYDFDENPPIENKIYLSNGTSIQLYSQFSHGDGFDCRWTSTSRSTPMTTTSATSFSATPTLSGKTSSSTATALVGLKETSKIPSTTSATIPTTKGTTSAGQTTSTATTRATIRSIQLPANPTCATFDPACGLVCGPLTSTGGVVQSLNFSADYVGSSDCIAIIAVSPGRGIQLTFTDLNLAPGDYVSVSDAQGDIIMRSTFGNQIKTTVLNSSTSQMTINLKGYSKNKSGPFNLKATFTAV